MTEYLRVTPKTPDLIEMLTDYINTHGGGRDLHTQHRKPEERPGFTQREVYSLVSQSPRRQAFTVAVDDGKIIGFVHYSVPSSAFLGGNDYALLHTQVDPAVDPLYVVEVQEKLTEASLLDNEDV